jgi:hypothetical protein
MITRSVVRDQIQDQSDTRLVQCRKHLIEIYHRAERRIDGAVVGNVVAEIGHQAFLDRRQPYRIDAELAQVVDSLQKTGEIALAVTVGVLEGDERDLIDYRTSPPTLSFRLFTSLKPPNLATFVASGCS